MIKRLQTVEEVIAELGGPKAVGQLTERKSASAVPMWKNRKRFPPKTYTILQAALKERGLSAPNDLWGMP
jgi:hypothetical protein